MAFTSTTETVDGEVINVISVTGIETLGDNENTGFSGATGVTYTRQGGRNVYTLNSATRMQIGNAVATSRAGSASTITLSGFLNHDTSKNLIVFERELITIAQIGARQNFAIFTVHAGSNDLSVPPSTYNFGVQTSAVNGSRVANQTLQSVNAGQIIISPVNNGGSNNENYRAITTQSNVVEGGISNILLNFDGTFSTGAFVGIEITGFLPNTLTSDNNDIQTLRLLLDSTTGSTNNIFNNGLQVLARGGPVNDLTNWLSRLASEINSQSQFGFTAVATATTLTLTPKATKAFPPLAVRQTTIPQTAYTTNVQTNRFSDTAAWTRLEDTPPVFSDGTGLYFASTRTGDSAAGTLWFGLGQNGIWGGTSGHWLGV